MHSISDCAVLHNGVRMPWLGLGVYKTQDGEEVEQAVKAAVEAGYRSIDTASLYHNERGVGKAIQACGIPREDLFITTKIWNSNQGYDSTLYAFEESLKKLGLEYLDLYLIHWPVKEKYKETWRAMEKLYKDGLVRAIGVSNFHVHHLEDLLTSAHIIPMVNQVEFHPRLTQKTLLIFCKEKGIQLEAWSPLMRGRLLDEPMLNNIARKHGKTPVQVILRWDLQHEVVTIPKSVHAERIAANADIFDFTLSDEEMRQIDALNRNERSGQDPDHFHFDF
ncbi:aldo/keto reductase [Aneurinibacillus aneurinilyticus]|uniref:Aldo/keto reductase n=1 Tax=Aneurinibacillus aneurinilyticus TaxID=1391 RepID=A0A848CVU7_ANEAE|nr:aldo/keto reductase [Aneurinibacillus aneurinilyticus]MED0707202.1 aldo/keto reductase [Aneurinibacillus aneurinilyticus]MED0722061.1 aldo/keto reductase [Aneurinibacillus aneurinilyticus]MED0732570.1 aldo/keto reductase [Aneurinibacillus aneurinilyticus]MED0741403.1 aldo/keto reductase [Aneurinibacillus aneurinilyticus]NME99635.1 aldo/keto reductase [Aneurinibacillus aneurinilyticus]